MVPERHHHSASCYVGIKLSLCQTDITSENPDFYIKDYFKKWNRTQNKLLCHVQEKLICVKFPSFIFFIRPVDRGHYIISDFYLTIQKG